MKNSYLFVLVLITALGLYGCKKEQQSCKLGKVYISDANSTPLPNTYSYYADGRIQKIVYSNRSKDSLVYQNDSLWVITRDYRDSVIAVVEAAVNSNGAITSGLKTNFDFLGNPGSTETITATYDANGLLNTLSMNGGGGLMAYNYQNTGANRSSGRRFNGSTVTEEYIYFYNSTENKSGVDYTNGQFAPWFGKASANLLDSAYIILPTDTVRVKYTHSMDKNGYVSRTVQTFFAPGFDTKYYSYQFFDCSE